MPVTSDQEAARALLAFGRFLVALRKGLSWCLAIAVLAAVVGSCFGALQVIYSVITGEPP